MSETLNYRKNQIYRPLKRGGKTCTSVSWFVFKGLEKDDEVAGSTITAMLWKYDSRWWNLDPVVKPHESASASFEGALNASKWSSFS